MHSFGGVCMNSLDFRRDNRSTSTFKQNIDDYTERETVYGEALKLEIASRGKCQVTVDDHGVDNSGELITESLANHNLDKKYYIDGKLKYIEIKTAPEYLESFYTFKVFSIKEAIRQNGIVALVKFNYYYLFGKEALSWMLSNLEHRIYKGFSPNDIAVRVKNFHIDEFVKQKWVIHRNWRCQARSFLDTKRDILLREKVI